MGTGNPARTRRCQFFLVVGDPANDRFDFAFAHCCGQGRRPVGATDYDEFPTTGHLQVRQPLAQLAIAGHGLALQQPQPEHCLSPQNVCRSSPGSQIAGCLAGKLLMANSVTAGIEQSPDAVPSPA
jgi:hypothetical protein